MDRQFQSSLDPNDAAEMWAATYTLMGLRYPPEMAKTILRGVRQMRESTTFQAILEEGRQEGLQLGLKRGEADLRRTILQLGPRILGEPSPQTITRLEAESGIERLEELTQRMATAKSWEELFG